MFVLGSDADTPETLTRDSEVRPRLAAHHDPVLCAHGLARASPDPSPRRGETDLCLGRLAAYSTLSTRWFVPRASVPLNFKRESSAFPGSSIRLAKRSGNLVQGRWYDFAIRLRGSFLTRRIVRDSASYTRALDKFDQVRVTLTAELDTLSEKARMKLREFGVGFEESRAQVEAGFEDLYRQFQATCDRLNLKLVPYGQALREMTSKKLEKYLRALATEPPAPTSSNLANTLETPHP